MVDACFDTAVLFALGVKTLCEVDIRYIRVKIFLSSSVFDTIACAGIGKVLQLCRFKSSDSTIDLI